jgi:hypothetical protein
MSLSEFLGRLDLIEKSRMGLITLVSSENAYTLACCGIGIALLANATYQIYRIYMESKSLNQPTR